jgi:hypothetical protein
MSLRDPDSELSGLTGGNELTRGEKSHLWDLNPGPALYESGVDPNEAKRVLQAVLQEPTLTRIAYVWSRLPLHIHAAIEALISAGDS